MDKGIVYDRRKLAIVCSGENIVSLSFALWPFARLPCIVARPEPGGRGERTKKDRRGEEKGAEGEAKSRRQDRTRRGPRDIEKSRIQERRIILPVAVSHRRLRSTETYVRIFMRAALAEFRCSLVSSVSFLRRFLRRSWAARKLNLGRGGFAALTLTRQLLLGCGISLQRGIFGKFYRETMVNGKSFELRGSSRYSMQFELSFQLSFQPFQ